MSNEFPWYLLYPLTASFLFALGLLFVKRASQLGASSLMIACMANIWTALLFSALWLLGGASEPLERMWQPGIVAVIYLMGQVCTFVAVQRGDVSVASPIFGMKVLMVAVFLTVIDQQVLSGYVWFAATAAAVGVAMIQRNGGSQRHGSIVASIIFALMAATSFALFDVLVQRWAPAWGPGRFLPLVFWMAAVVSVLALPILKIDSLRDRRIRRPLLFGSFLTALQALFIVLTVAFYGDAARVNIVYSLRGIWGVGLAWLFARWLGGGEMHLAKSVMASRLIGASLVTAAVVIAIAAQSA